MKWTSANKTADKNAAVWRDITETARPSRTPRKRNSSIVETTTAVPPQEMARRAWTLAQRTMERVVRAGRYLAKGDAAQEKLWRAYRPAKKAKTPAPTPTPDA